MSEDRKPIERLLEMELRLEDRLRRRGPGHPVRDAMAIVRGCLELALLYGEPLDVLDMKRRLTEIRAVVGSDSHDRGFLDRIAA